MVTTEYKEWFDNQIKTLDPHAEIIRIDDSTDNSRINYSNKLGSDETRQRNQEPEEYVHALFLCMMCSDEYGYNIEDFYHEKDIPKGSSGSDQLDYVLYDKNGDAYAAIELKQYKDYSRKKNKAIRDQLFALAPQLGKPSILIYATIKADGSKPHIKSETINYKKYSNYTDWKNAGAPSVKNNIPYKYLDINFTPLIRKGSNELREDCTQSDFRSVANMFHNEFFGEHPDNTLFTNVVKCLLAKIYDERTGKDGQPYQFQIFVEDGKEKEGCEEDAHKLFDRVNNLYKSAYTRYIDPGASISDEINVKEFSIDKVREVVRALQDMSITRGAALNSDIIGAFFEEILRVGFKQDKGMYFTHSNIARFMLEAIDLEGLTKETFKTAKHPDNRLPKIIDPACGSGTFLMNAMPIVTNAIRGAKRTLVNDDESRQFFNSNMNDKNPNFWARDYIYGFDPKFVMAITAKVNMVLHGDGSTHIYKYDAFSPFSKYNDAQLRVIGDDARSIDKTTYPKELCESFDVVVSNPPFGITLSSETYKTIPDTFTLQSKTSSESLFIERCFQLLKENGRMALVLPESVINTNDNEYVRLFLYRMFKIKAIVSLPRNIFIDTPTLTSLLFAQKKKASEIQEWDEYWAESYTEAQEKIKYARRCINSKIEKTFSDPSEVEKTVCDALSGVISKKEWVIKKGKNTSIFFLTLPSEILKVADACAYYREVLSSASIEKYIIRYAFDNTSRKLNYNFDTFQVDEVGYKLSKRKEKERPNQLCTFIGNESKKGVYNLNVCSEPYYVSIDTKNPKTVLDYIRKEVKWDR